MQIPKNPNRDDSPPAPAVSPSFPPLSSPSPRLSAIFFPFRTKKGILAQRRGGAEIRKGGCGSGEKIRSRPPAEPSPSKGSSFPLFLPTSAPLRLCAIFFPSPSKTEYSRGAAGALSFLPVSVRTIYTQNMIPVVRAFRVIALLLVPITAPFLRLPVSPTHRFSVSSLFCALWLNPGPSFFGSNLRAPAPLRDILSLPVEKEILARSRRGR